MPYAAGGGVDTVARGLAQDLGDALRQSVIVDNRPGANSVIGTEHVARAAADGYSAPHRAAALVCPHLGGLCCA